MARAWRIPFKALRAQKCLEVMRHHGYFVSFEAKFNLRR
jgi:hypothetical protein